MLKIVSADTLELADYIRSGDMITWGQGTAEPLGLINRLVDQRHTIGNVGVFIGLSLADLFRPEHTDFITFTSYGALGTNSRLGAAGALRLIPCNYSAVPRLIESGRLAVDVVFVQISPAGPDGTHSLGFCNDYLPVAMKNARVVIAEINPHVPWTHLDAPLDENNIDFAIESDIEPPPLGVAAPGDVEDRIAAHIAAVVEDGATLQYGIGSIPAAMLKALSGHRDLGLHSGLVTEEIIDLIESGVITNARKAVYPGVSVGAVAMGGARLKNFLHDNPAFQLHQNETTHGARTLSQIDNLVSINSALEVDLYGQVNAEQIGERYVGAIGGQVDYMHAAAASRHGLSVIALPASLGKSGRSRITESLNGPIITTSRTSVDMVITEFGIADLRGRSLEERARSLIDIAPPEHRDQLSAGLY